MRSSSDIVVVEERRSGNVRVRPDDRIFEPRGSRGSIQSEMRVARREEMRILPDLDLLRRAPHSGSSSGSDRDEPARGGSNSSYASHDRRHTSPYVGPAEDRYGPVTALQVNERERSYGRPLVDPYPRLDRLGREDYNYSISGHRSDLQLRRNRLDRP